MRTKSDEHAVDQGCYFDLASAERVRTFFSSFLRHSKGDFARKKFELLDWQWRDVIAPLFGWKMPDGTRRFRRAGIGIPKKNGKSTLLSGIGLYMLCGDKEQGAEIYSAAASRDQASIIYNEAACMVESSPALASRVRLRRQAKEMVYEKSNGFYKALSADVPTKDGLNIHCLLFDELHTQPNWNLWNVLRYGFAARKQPLLLWISTAGVYDPTSIGYTQWQHARNVLSGAIIDVSFLPCIYEAGEEEDWREEATFSKANPSYLHTIAKRDFDESVKEAIDIPSNENSYKRYRLNVWTKQASKWIPAKAWDARKREYPWPKRKDKCWFGLDLATTTDIAAGVLLWRADDVIRVRPYFWIPARGIERRREENLARMDAWAGTHIKVTNRPTIDYEVIRADVNAIADGCKMVECAIDPHNATQLATWLEDDGIKVVYVRQGFLSLSPATKEFERLVLGGGIEHPGNPVLDWMMGNVGLETDAAGNVKPSKSASAEKIDGIAALVTGLARMIDTGAGKRSRYEDKKLEML